MKVSLFITCLADVWYPDVGESTVRLLQRLGCTVDFPMEQTCCGQPAFNSGYVQEARSAAMTLLDAFEQADYVVAPSGSCTGMIHHYYDELFRDDPQLLVRAKRLQEKTYELSQFIVLVLGVTDVGAVFPYKVAFHPSCHAARLLGVREEPLALLRNVRELELLDLVRAEDCCGFGGTFAVKMSDISGAMVAEKGEHVVETEADVLVGSDMGCLMNIGGWLRKNGSVIRVMHLAQLLEEGVAYSVRHSER